MQQAFNLICGLASDVDACRHAQGHLSLQVGSHGPCGRIAMQPRAAAHERTTPRSARGIRLPANRLPLLLPPQRRAAARCQ
eukprot:359394-Chlamydomonas_euryale.AAC.4